MNANINFINITFNSNFKDLRSTVENNLAMIYSKFAALEKRIEWWKTKTSNMNGYVSQLANSISDIQARISRNLPSNTFVNPKSINAISLRSEKTVGKLVLKLKS